MAGPGPVPINAPFEVDAACSVRSTVEGTDMVLGYRRDANWSFYNKGLTLAVVHDVDFVGGRFRHIAFKVKSRYLEHTLSRETVIRDENYHRAMEVVAAEADGDLRGELVSQLRGLAGSSAWDVASHGRYFARLFFLSHEQGFEDFETVPLLRTVDGRALSLDDAWDAARRDDRLFVSDAATPLTAALGEQGIPVFLAEVGEDDDDARAMRRLLARYVYHRLAERGVVGKLRRLLVGAALGERVAAMITRPARIFVSVVEVEPSTAMGALFDDTRELLTNAQASPGAGEGTRKRVPVGYDALVPVRLSGASGDAPLFVTGRRIDPLMALPPPGSLPSYHRRRPVAGINIDHPHLHELVRLHGCDPVLGAYGLARSITLTEDRLLFEETDLLVAARELDRAGGLGPSRPAPSDANAPRGTP